MFKAEFVASCTLTSFLLTALTYIFLCVCVCLCVSLPHPFLSALLPLPCIPLFPADPERSLYDSAERPCGGLYIWRCHVRFSGAAKLGDAFKSQQLSLSRAQADSLCGFAGLPAERVGNFTQLPQSLHITCECTSSQQLTKY